MDINEIEIADFALKLNQCGVVTDDTRAGLSIAECIAINIFSKLVDNSESPATEYDSGKRIGAGLILNAIRHANEKLRSYKLPDDFFYGGKLK